MLANKLIEAAGGIGTTYVDSVFSTYLYTGNGATQAITDGINLSGNGGMVWIKGRSGTTDHAIYDTARGATYDIGSNLITGQTTEATGVTAFSSSGFSIGALAKLNTNSATYAAWAFSRSPKFFDVVTYTGNGSNRTIAHNLGSVPGMIIVKRTDTSADWQVYHRSLASNEYCVLNTTAGKATGATRWNSTTATASSFSLGTDASVNANTGTYVAYVFAHDAASDGLIQCGSYAGSGAAGNVVSLGWEPQLVLIKRVDTTSSWGTFDNMRGFVANSAAGSTGVFALNTSSAESAGANNPYITSSGFGLAGSNASYNATGGTYIYLAIRRSNRIPSSGTQVFAPATRTGTGAAATTTAAGFTVDLVITKKRSSTTLAGARFIDRLRGATKWLDSTATTVETATADTVTGLDSMTGISLGADATTSAFNTNTHTYVDEYFKRAAGVFDVVCYAGTGANTTISHQLGVAPEMMIFKSRVSVTNWAVYHKDVGATKAIYINGNGTPNTASTFFNDTAPSASVFSLGSSGTTNDNTSGGMVAYLFATLPGISKVGSYTGNGSSQTINCGFGAGARFVLIKRTDSTGDWFIFDTSRGISTTNDPHLSLNTTAAEVTTDDSIDPDSTGFIVNQLAATNINVNGASYIYLSIS